VAAAVAPAAAATAWALAASWPAKTTAYPALAALDPMALPTLPVPMMAMVVTGFSFEWDTLGAP
jgi:hypothetical protein